MYFCLILSQKWYNNNVEIRYYKYDIIKKGD
nr:MAG TPA: hypothetical protein [Caudoviricetes sp.]